MKKQIMSLAWAILIAMAWSATLAAENNVPPARLKLLNHGINIPNLLQENNKFNSFQTDDLKKLQAIGIANIRIPVEIGYVLPGFKTPGLGHLSTQKDCDHALTSLDTFVKDFTKAGFPVTIALFMHEQCANLPVAESKALMLKAMDAISRRYARKYTPDQLFFDVNEPFYDAGDWNEIAPSVVEIIRKNAPDHTIIIEPCRSGTNFIAQLKPLQDPNIIYAMHIYFPSEFTLQGQPGKNKPDPDLRFPAPRQSQAKLEAWMRKGIDWATTNHVPLIVNEFGCGNAADPPSRLNWIKTVRKLAEKYDLPWSYWSFSGKLFGLKPGRTSEYDPALVEALSTEPAQIPAAK